MKKYLVLITAVYFVLISCAYSQKSARDFNEDGYDYIKQGKYEEAVWCFDQAIAKARNASFFANRAYAHEKLGIIDHALKDYFEALKCDPSVGKYHYSIGNIYLNIKDTSQALIYYSKAIDLSPAKEKYFLKRGNLYYMRKAYKNAIQDFKKVLDLNQDMFIVYLKLGYAHYMLKKKENPDEFIRSEEACEYWDIAAKHGISGADDFIKKHCENKMQMEFEMQNQSTIYYLQFNNQKVAIIELETEPGDEMVDNFHDLFTASIQRTDIFEYLFNNKVYPAEARTDSIEGDIEVRVKIASDGNIESATIEEGKNVHPLLDEEALRLVRDMPTLFYTQGIEISKIKLKITIPFVIHDTEYDYVFRRTASRKDYDEGVKCMKNGDLNLAIDHFNNAIKYYDSHINSYFNRALVYFKLGEYDQACVDFNRCSSLGDKQGAIFYKSVCNNDSLANLYFKDGYMHFEEKQYEKAEKCLIESCKQSEETFNSIFFISITLLRLEKRDSALIYWFRANNLNPDRSLLLLNLVCTKEEQLFILSNDESVKTKNKNYKSSLISINKMIFLMPENAELLIKRAELFYLLNNKSKACKDYKSAQKLGVKETESLLRKYCE